MNSPKVWLTTFMAVSAVVIMAPAGTGQNTGGRGYNPSTETTVKGTVEEVKQLPMRGGPGGTHVTLKTDKGVLDVHLGPSAFLAERHFEISKGDQIEVTGSKMSIDGTEALVAREVKKGSQVLTLRNANGIPLWSGGPMGRGGMGPGMGRGMGMGRPGMGMGRGMGPGMGNMATGTSAQSSGSEIFAARCAQCHYADRAEKKIGPGMKGIFEQKKLANGKAATEANIRALIEHGAEGMPGYAKILSKQQLDELIGYLKTL
jgi:mono/diheme cytochrome c family protein